MREEDWEKRRNKKLKIQTYPPLLLILLSPVIKSPEFLKAASHWGKLFTIATFSFSVEIREIDEAVGILA